MHETIYKMGYVDQLNSFLYGCALIIATNPYVINLCNLSQLYTYPSPLFSILIQGIISGYLTLATF